MKAIVKATGKVVEINSYDTDTEGNLYYYTKNYDAYHENEIEIIIGEDLDYWERLKHQYAGMAMQGIMANSLFMPYEGKEIADISNDIATALVKKLKEE